MEYPMLFSEAELPIPVNVEVEKPSMAQKVVGMSRKALKALRDSVNFNIWDLLDKPVLLVKTKRQQKTKKRKLEWDDAKTFLGSVTITQHRTDVDQSHVLAEWSSAHLWEAHCWLFEESMEALKAEDNSEEKLDILEWIFSPSFIEKASRSHLGRPCLIRRHVTDIPFSFVNCCRAVGISDPDDFREMLVEQMSDEFRPQLRKYLHATQGTRLNT